MTRSARGGWWAVLVAVLVLLVAGAVDGVIERRIGEQAPEIFDDTRVRLGGTATIDGVEITVDRLQSAYLLKPRSADQPDQATGIFLVFWLHTAASGSERVMSLAGDLSYAGLTATVRNFPTTEPGTGSSGQSYVEVDPHRLRETAGRQPVRLRLWHQEITYRFRQRAVIDLQIDQQRADALLEAPRDRVLQIPESTSRGLR